jgi:hypothetical protein
VNSLKNARIGHVIIRLGRAFADDIVMAQYLLHTHVRG